MAPSATTNGTSHTNGSTTAPKIHLYTNHGCPYAHRAHITLQELGLEFEETIIDLTTPRPQWYLDINPRGLVPSIKYTLPGVTDGEEIITESAVVSQFLADSFPSHLLPSSTEGPLKRARINWFLDTWENKVQSQFMTVIRADEAEKEKRVDDWIAALRKEIEPLLADASPFFGASKDLTFVEAITAPFILRTYALARDGTLIPTSLLKKLEGLPNFSKWTQAMSEKDSVTGIWDEEEFVTGMKKRMASLQQKK